jgi:hypothetical protein
MCWPWSSGVKNKNYIKCPPWSKVKSFALYQPAWCYLSEVDNFGMSLVTILVSCAKDINGPKYYTQARKSPSLCQQLHIFVAFRNDIEHDAEITQNTILDSR